MSKHVSGKYEIKPQASIEPRFNFNLENPSEKLYNSAVSSCRGSIDTMDKRMKKNNIIIKPGMVRDVRLYKHGPKQAKDIIVRNYQTKKEQSLFKDFNIPEKLAPKMPISPYVPKQKA